MERDYVQPLAYVCSPWGELQTVPTMSVQRWAWEDPDARREYKKAYRKYVLADLTSDPRGWSVRWGIEGAPMYIG